MSNMMGPLREDIASTDAQIIKLLEKRFDLVKQVWDIKKQNAIPLRDERKETELIEQLQEKSTVNKEFLSIMYKQIFNENERLFG